MLFPVAECANHLTHVHTFTRSCAPPDQPGQPFPLPRRRCIISFTKKGTNHDWKKHVSAESDTNTHQYTLILNKDNTYEVQVDGSKKEDGTLEKDWALLKPKVIPDPNEKKPSDWVDEAEMDDPDDHKPADWDAEPR